jgi:hypothetical protein
LLVALAATACAKSEPEETKGPASAAPEAAAASVAPSPAESPVAPQAAKPLFVDKGKTIGECAQYGKWWTKDALPVYAAEGDMSTVAFTLKPHEGFTATTGDVLTIAYGTAIAPKGATAYTEDGKQVPLAVGEELQLVHYVGEGSWAMTRNGRTEQVDLSMVMEGAKGFQRPETQWWANIKTKAGQTGWLLVDRDHEFAGIDGCGGPLPAWAK